VCTTTDSQDEEVDKFLTSGAVTVTRSYRQRLSRGKLAVSMSHLRLWKRIVKEHIPLARILEDDVKVLDGFPETLACILSEVPEDHHFVYLYSHPRHCHPNRPDNHLPGKQYVMGYSYTCSRLAYVVNTEGARRLIAYFRTLFDHGDVMINRAIESGLLHRYMSPKVLVHNLGQLTKSYDNEVPPSNIWPVPTCLSIMRRRLRELYEDVRK